MLSLAADFWKLDAAALPTLPEASRTALSRADGGRGKRMWTRENVFDGGADALREIRAWTTERRGASSGCGCAGGKCERGKCPCIDDFRECLPATCLHCAQDAACHPFLQPGDDDVEPVVGADGEADVVARRAFRTGDTLAPYLGLVAKRSRFDAFHAFLVGACGVDDAEDATSDWIAFLAAPRADDDDEEETASDDRCDDGETYLLDTRFFGNVTALIRAATATEEANCNVARWVDASGAVRLVVAAVRPIGPGDALRLTYVRTPAMTLHAYLRHLSLDLEPLPAPRETGAWDLPEIDDVRYLSRNVFVDDGTRQLVAYRFEEAMVNECACDGVCDDGMDCPCNDSWMECRPGVCSCACTGEREIDTSLVRVRRMQYPGDEQPQFELVAARDIPAETVVCEYSGVVMLESTLDHVLARMETYTGETSFYVMDYPLMDDEDDEDEDGVRPGGQAVMLDARFAGGVARFANNACDNSCTMTSWFGARGDLRLLMMTRRDLRAGDAITIRYGWNTHECKCGGAACTGKM